jgi:hypothetical protein
MAKKKKKARKVRRKKAVLKTKTARLNLLIRPDLKEWAHDYARRREKSLSALVTEYLLDLRDRDLGVDVEQI